MDGPKFGGYTKVNISPALQSKQLPLFCPRGNCKWFDVEKEEEKKS